MSEFTPIMTQEDFDKAIQKRLAQKEREVAEQFKDFLSPQAQSALKEEYENKLTKAGEDLKAAQDKIKSHTDTVSDLTKRAETAESRLLKSKIAYEHKLPLELADRLVGDTKEDLDKDAETLAELMRETQAGLMKPSATAPLHTNEVRSTTANGNGSVDTGMMQLLSQLSDTFQN